jgi:hypothetical protein
LVAETFNGFEDEDGCPDTNISQPDADGDGVPDIMDMCPTQKETWNKYVDYDGCPDTIPIGKTTIDTDGDRINDDVDKCPNDKETFNKFQDDDGCPDTSPEQSRYKHDDDLDGIVNNYDLCPTVPEDYLGVIDGCQEQ